MIWYEKKEIEPKIVPQYEYIKHEGDNLPDGFSYKADSLHRLIQVEPETWDHKQAKWVEEKRLLDEKKLEMYTRGGMQYINNDGFDAFQCPVDTNITITNERQRRDLMKQHGCVDSREFIPHGKTSLLDA